MGALSRLRCERAFPICYSMFGVGRSAFACSRPRKASSARFKLNAPKKSICFFRRNNAPRLLLGKIPCYSVDLRYKNRLKIMCGPLFHDLPPQVELYRDNRHSGSEGNCHRTSQDRSPPRYLWEVSDSRRAGRADFGICPVAEGQLQRYKTRQCRKCSATQSV